MMKFKDRPDVDAKGNLRRRIVTVFLGIGLCFGFSAPARPESDQPTPLSTLHSPPFPLQTPSLPLDVVRHWKKDGAPFLYLREKGAIDEIWGFLSDFATNSPNRMGEIPPLPRDTTGFIPLRSQSRFLRGKIVRIEGRLLRTRFVATPTTPPLPEITAHPAGYYESWVLLDDEPRIPLRLLTLAPLFPPLESTEKKPESAETAPPLGRERIVATGVYYRQASYNAGDDFYNSPILVAERLERHLPLSGSKQSGENRVSPAPSPTHPPVLSASISPDDLAAAAETLRNAKKIVSGLPVLPISEVETIADPIERGEKLRNFRLTDADTVPFYTLLGSAALFSAFSAAGAEIHDSLQLTLPPTDFSPSELFRHPEEWQGEPVVVTGRVRRARRIDVHSAESRRLLGRDHYYEIYLFSPETQGYPVVVCIADLPAECFASSESDSAEDGISADLENLPQKIRLGTDPNPPETLCVTGIFYKLWAYTKTPDSSGKTPWIAVPLILGTSAKLLPNPEDRTTDSDNRKRFGGFLSLFFAILVTYWLLRRFRRPPKKIEFRVGREHIPLALDKDHFIDILPNDPFDPSKTDIPSDKA